jgi:hypothetical protein
MVIVGDRKTAENTNTGGYESKQKRVYGDGQDKGNDRTAGDQDHEARVQREQLWVVLQKLFALDDAANEAVQEGSEHEDGKLGKPLDEGGKPVGGQREQRANRLEVLVVEQARAHLRHLRCGGGVDLVARLGRRESDGDGARLLRVGVKLKHARQDA